MSSVLENGKIDSASPIVPIAIDRSSNAGVAKLQNREQRIADRLFLGDFGNVATIGKVARSLVLVDGRDSARSRLPSAWGLLTELVADKPKGEVERQLNLLLHSLDSMSQDLVNEREAHREYVGHLQLYSMMPVYLCLDRRNPSHALQESIALARESIVLVDLDEALEAELFELLAEPAFTDSPPCIAIGEALNIRLDYITARLDERARSTAKTRAASAHLRPSKEHCEGYWSIVKQWKEKAAHLRIPSKLSIGSIAWPKVLEHWTRLSNALLDIVEANDTLTPQAEFVEIRSSNDPQLSETLDSHLQRCRSEHGSMALVVVQMIKPEEAGENSASSIRLPEWQRVVIEQLHKATDGSASRGFVCQAGELALIVDGMERNEVTAVLREVLEIACRPIEVVSQMIETPDLPLVCGVACVTSPSKGFKIDQLTNTAWRCLEAAKTQGAGAVKSLEVY